jgi:hypothetical protein
LLTVLLVLAILSSSALVFTNRVELLKLAVILSLWAAVVAAFVSVTYRRQSDSDQARARDLKLVYDLQLDREISARREYELTLETHLRRELASELRAQADDEVAALRAELAALRTSLEILFDTDLAQRPAIETDRPTVRALSEWADGPEATGRVASSTIDTEDIEAHTEENPIIDVPEEPEPAESPWDRMVLGTAHSGRVAPSAEHAGAHRRPSEEAQNRRPKADKPRGRRRRAEETPVSSPTEAAEAPQAPPDEVPERPIDEPESVADSPVGESTVPPQISWQPAPAEGSWIPAGTPGSNWVSPVSVNGSSPDYVGRRRARETAMSTPRRRGTRQSAAAEAEPDQPSPSVPPESSSEPVAEPEPEGAHTGGQSVAELLARLQAGPTGGGGRRRRGE